MTKLVWRRSYVEEETKFLQKTGVSRHKCTCKCKERLHGWYISCSFANDDYSIHYIIGFPDELLQRQVYNPNNTYLNLTFSVNSLKLAQAITGVVSKPQQMNHTQPRNFQMEVRNRIFLIRTKENIHDT